MNKVGIIPHHPPHYLLITLRQISGQIKHELNLPCTILVVGFQLHFQPNKEVEIKNEEDDPLNLLCLVLGSSLLDQGPNPSGEPPGETKWPNNLTNKVIWHPLRLDCMTPPVWQILVS